MKRPLKLLTPTLTNLCQWTRSSKITTALIAESKHTNLLNLVSNHNHMHQFLSHMIVSNTPIDHFSLKKMIEISLSFYDFNTSALLFTQFHELLDSEICNNIVRCYTQLNKHLNSVFVYTQMRKIGVLPDTSTIPAVLKSVAQLCRGDFGKSVHCSVIQMGLESDIYSSTALVHMYCICALPGIARRLFDEMPDRNAVSWNALITGYVHNRKFWESIEIFREMLAVGPEPGEVTMVGVLSACAHLGTLNQGRWIHDYIERKRLRMNVFVGTALIDMYSKCGVLDEAKKTFEAMKSRNVYTWNVFISGCAMNGQSETALRAFSRMLVEKFKPDEITFLGILCACCHQGLIEEGRKHFKSMKEEFRLIPRIEHYGCMVDLLGRAGFLDEAQKLIDEMVIEPDPIIWRALLGACRIHKQACLGEFAIRKLLELEPQNRENYVLLSNLYARDKNWVKMGEIRKLMNWRGIRKVPGCSSIEIGSVFYEFVASDTIEEGYDEVYKLLADMKKQLKVAGYAMDTDMVLYDLEEEEKEHTLIYHSEKLALAFGLLRSSPDTTLRIVKNLRICQDCHMFFKLVSLVYRRDIIVRDRNRFHHFSQGVCSCKDFW